MDAEHARSAREGQYVRSNRGGQPMVDVAPGDALEDGGADADTDDFCGVHISIVLAADALDDQRAGGRGSVADVDRRV